jgi:hypothetical protein
MGKSSFAKELVIEKKTSTKTKMQMNNAFDLFSLCFAKEMIAYEAGITAKVNPNGNHRSGTTAHELSTTMKPYEMPNNPRTEMTRPSL